MPHGRSVTRERRLEQDPPEIESLEAFPPVLRDNRRLPTLAHRDNFRETWLQSTGTSYADVFFTVSQMTSRSLSGSTGFLKITPSRPSSRLRLMMWSLS
jgi:hypothetical protein